MEEEVLLEAHCRLPHSMAAPSYVADASTKAKSLKTHTVGSIVSYLTAPLDLADALSTSMDLPPLPRFGCPGGCKRLLSQVTDLLHFPCGHWSCASCVVIAACKW